MPRRPYFPVELFEQVAPFESPRSVDLDRRVDHLLRHLGGEELCHCRMFRDFFARVVAGRGGVHEQPRRLDLRRHVCELLADRLELSQLPAEGLTFARMSKRGIERGLSHPNRKGPHARAEEIECSHGDLETLAHLTEHGLGLDAHSIERHRPDGMWSNQLERLPSETRAISRNDKSCDSRRAGVVGCPSEHRVHVGERSVRDPLLLAGQPPAVSVRRSLESQCSRVAPRPRLRQREGGHGSPLSHLWDPASR